MAFYFRVKKCHQGNSITVCGREVVEALLKREANAKLNKISRAWPPEEDGSFYFLGQYLYGPYDTQKEAEDATLDE